MPSIDRNLALLFLITTVLAVYWNMTGTFIPLFIRSLDASVFQVSLVLFIGGVAATSLMLPSGFLSDRYGRRKLIIVSTAFLFMSSVLYASAKTWEETILYTVINMVAYSLFNPARMTMIADIVKPKSMGKAYGLMNLSWPAGSIFGPSLGGFIAENYGWTSFFYASCVFAVICALLSLFLSESVKHPEKEVKKNHKSFSRETVIILTLFVLIHVLGNTGRGILNTTFPFYLTENFQKTKTEVGVFFSLAFGVATFISQVTSGFTADRLGRKKTMTYSVFPIPFLALLFLFASDYVSTFLVYMAIMALWSATWPASAAYLMEMSSASRRGLMMGLRLTAVRLGFTIGPLIGGFLWDNFGMTTSFYTVTAFLASSFILILLLKE